MDDSREVIIDVNHSFQEENDGEITIPLNEQKVDSVDYAEQTISHDKEQNLFMNELRNLKSLFHNQLGEITHEFSNCQKVFIVKSNRRDFEDKISSIEGRISQIEDDVHDNKKNISTIYKMMEQNKDLVNHNNHMSDIVNTENISKGVGQAVPDEANQTNQNTEKQQQNTDNIYSFNKDKMYNINQNYAILDRPQVPRLTNSHTHSPKSSNADSVQTDARFNTELNDDKGEDLKSLKNELSDFKRELVSLSRNIKGMSQNQNRNSQGGGNQQRNYQNGQRGYNNQNKNFGQGNRNFNQRNNNFGQNQNNYYQQGNQLSSAKSCYKVAIQETVDVPPNSEMIVSGESDEPIFRGLAGLIEPNEKFMEKNGLLVARSIVHPEMYNIPLRIINLNKEPCTLYKGTIIATCNKVDEEDIQTSEFVNSVAGGQAIVNKGRQLPDYLHEVFESSQANLDKDQKEKFRDLLIEYSDIFSKSSEDIGLTDLVEHTINTGNHPPVRQRPRRIPLARMKDAEAEIQKMVKQDIIEPSTSPWNSNIVLVKKSDGSWRFCIDFRAVNLLVLRPSYPLPRIDDTIDSLSGSKFFSTVDLKSGYYQIPVAKEDRPKTAFSFPGGGLWQFKRMPMGLCNSAPVFEQLMETVLSESQLSDDVISIIIQWKIDEVKPIWADVSHMSPEVKFYWSRLNSLILVNGILYRKWESYNGKHYDLHIVLPANFKRFVLNQVHNTVTGGHLGVRKTLSKIKQRYFWYKMRQDVKFWCTKCDICASKKAPCKKPKAPMKQYLVGAPWERMAIDILGPLPISVNNNRYLMVVQDYFSKWTEAIPIPDTEAVTVAKKFVERIVTIFGVPLSIHSDQGSNFESNVFKEMCIILGIHKTRTTPFRPKSDGMVEKSNSTIETMLSAFVSKHQRDWDEYIYLLMLAYRSSEHESLGTSPCSMLFGREVNLPVDLILGRPETEKSPLYLKTVYAYELSQKLEVIHKFARNKLKLSSDRMKRNYDVGTKMQTFDAGDPVWLHNPRRVKGLCPKLQNNWEGPYIVVNKLNDVIYRIQKGPKMKPKVVHQDRLKPYLGENVPVWFN
ncbi:unnamed protein product [Mytilus edulis]|uniref:Integrase catalytic domain-containing protein n=1 Tax=Mytilus edulis TaxID=6550 RepID=A0A8S3V669_MYTED|nr:unnamed protein product [Mytilus edulis]